MKTLARPQDKDELLERLGALRPDSSRRWGRMSTHQMLCHVNDAWRMMLGDRPAKPATNLIKRTIMKWVALHLPIPWPPGIPTSPEADQEREGTQPTEFAADVAQTRALLERITASSARFDGHAHPYFGKMSHATWLRWAYLHADHHFRQFGA